MSKWTGVVLFDASKYFEVEADTQDEAFAAAYEQAGHVSLCHQCASEIDVGDALGVLAYDEAGAEHTDEWRELKIMELTQQRDALLAALERIAAAEKEVDRGGHTEVINDETVDCPGIAKAALDAYRSTLPQGGE